MENVNNFNKKIGFCVLFMNSDVGGCGYDLSSCNKMLFLNSYWNAQSVIQSIYRIVRINQLEDVEINMLITLDTIETKIFQSFIFKYFIFEFLFNNKKNIDVEMVQKIVNDNLSEKIVKKVEDFVK